MILQKWFNPIPAGGGGHKADIKKTWELFHQSLSVSKKKVRKKPNLT